MKKTKRQNGFTLIETVIAIAIVAFGITGLMFAMAAGTRVNEYSGELSDAVYLADQIGVIVDGTAFDDLPLLNGVVYNAVDSSGNVIDGMSNFTQSLTVQAFDPLGTGGAGPDAYLVSVTVFDSGVDMVSIQWLKAKSN